MGKTTIKINVFDIKSIEAAEKKLNDYKKDVEAKVKTLLERLATMGAVKASIEFSRAIYNGDNDVNISVEEMDNGYKIVASGAAVLFIEFGSGATYGYGHPTASEFGMGPGTYNPSSKRWENPNGWYYGDGNHTYGNPPAEAMYHTAEELKNEIVRVAREVFAG